MAITTSKIKNMKELRPGSSGRSEIRILFVFDPWQQIVLLVAGDKAGEWSAWYRKAIPRAEELYAEHVEAMENRGYGVGDALGRRVRGLYDADDRAEIERLKTRLLSDLKAHRLAQAPDAVGGRLRIVIDFGDELIAV